ncbi:membrane protein A44 [Aotine betaherpesvirus 1]|uniref:Membrane protein A44 n=1 Tax=Aotine betaherpesvirus 1 TaxID=50290 RepID=G8XUM2_9BETA|nr:membrane protein A44 [Aotine betaherpesvirus 1]AEV80864.1 membrane protein A44 [Aotine betaherpesvirus 1]
MPVMNVCWCCLLFVSGGWCSVTVRSGIIILGALVGIVYSNLPVNAIVGGNATIKVSQALPANVINITWLCNSDTKVVDWNNNSHGRPLTNNHSHFTGRVQLDSNTGVLYLWNITKADMGLYTRRIFKSDNSQQDHMVKVNVYEILTTPNITLVNATVGSNMCDVYLSCSYHNYLCKKSSKNCTWYYWDKNMSHPFPWYHSAKVNSCYTCEFKNPVQRINTTLCIENCNQTKMETFSETNIILAITSVRRHSMISVALSAVAVLCVILYRGYMYAK